MITENTTNNLYDNLPLTFPRRKTRAVCVGNITIGGGAPVVVQSMITEETRNVQACVRQIMQMHRAGAEIALHVLDVMESVQAGAGTGTPVTLTTTCERPERMPALVPLT